MTGSRAHLEIYDGAITLRFLLVERAAGGGAAVSGLWLGTVEEKTQQLEALVAQWPYEAKLAVDFMDGSEPHGAFYAEVISTLWSMIARGRGNALLVEMRG